MSPPLAVELARLLVAGASRETVEARLALESVAPALEPIWALGERARALGAGEEALALALGLSSVLGSAATGETTAP